MQKKVRYPRLAKKAGIEGTVVVRFRVDEGGNAQEVVVQQPIDRALDDAAIAAVRDASPFTSPPGWVRVPIEFSLTSAP